MAAAYTFPASLPQSPLMNQFRENISVNIIRSPMDLGVAKQRRRSSNPSVLDIGYIFTAANVTTFETFVLETIKGVARFNYTHPRTLEAVEVRIIPKSDGTLYSVEKQATDIFMVNFQLEILP
jgi:hypothetical protein